MGTRRIMRNNHHIRMFAKMNLWCHFKNVLSSIEMAYKNKSVKTLFSLSVELTWSIAAAWVRPEKNAQETRMSQQQLPKWSSVVQYNNPGERR